MQVQRIHTSGGSHIEPPLEDHWDDLTKLQWHAAVVRHDTGAVFDVVEAHVTRWEKRVGGLYAINHPGGCMTSYSFNDAWCLINGIDLGARLATGAVPTI